MAISQTAQVEASVFAVILGGTESLLNIMLSNGYRFEKTNLLVSPFRKKYLNENGQVISAYRFSQLPSEATEGINFICITKKDIFPCPAEAFSLSEIHDADIFRTVVEEWQEEQEVIIREILLALRIFKDGNIEIADVHYQYTCEVKPFDVTQKLSYAYECHHADSGDVYTDFYSLSDDEITTLNGIIAKNEYSVDFFDNAFDKFQTGCYIYHDDVAFSQLITVGEVLFVNYNSKDSNAIKQKLANRMAVWTSDTPSEIQGIHDEIIDFYKYRSEDTHKAVNTDITSINRKKLREYIRSAIKKYITRIHLEKQHNSAINIREIRRSIVLEIKNDVVLYKSNGLL